MFGYASNSSKVTPPLTFQMLKTLILGQYMGWRRHFAKHCKIAKSEPISAHPLAFCQIKYWMRIFGLGHEQTLWTHLLSGQMDANSFRTRLKTRLKTVRNRANFHTFLEEILEWSCLLASWRLIFEVSICEWCQLGMFSYIPSLTGAWVTCIRNIGVVRNGYAGPK